MIAVNARNLSGGRKRDTTITAKPPPGVRRSKGRIVEVQEPADDVRASVVVEAQGE